MGLPSITRFHFRSLINFTPCGLCRSSLFLSFWLLSSLCRGSVQNLSCDPEQSEGFPTDPRQCGDESGNDTENKYSISEALRSLPQGSSHYALPTFFRRTLSNSSGDLFASIS